MEGQSSLECPTTSPHNLWLRIASVSKSHFLTVLSLVIITRFWSLKFSFRQFEPDGSDLGNHCSGDNVCGMQRQRVSYETLNTDANKGLSNSPWRDCLSSFSNTHRLKKNSTRSNVKKKKLQWIYDLLVRAPSYACKHPRRMLSALLTYRLTIL